MQWLWNNSTQLAFGVNSVKESLPKWVKPGTKVLCTCGGGSIEKNGTKQDVVDALAALNCNVTWEGGICANPEYERLMEIVAVVKQQKPDLLLAVGGGSVLDGTKFISIAAQYPDNVCAYEEIFFKNNWPKQAIPVGDVITLPATGSEWDAGFVVSWRAKGYKQGLLSPFYPVFSIIDPRYTMTLPPRQLANGVWDAVTHCLDQAITPHPVPLQDDYLFSTIRELITIGPDVVKEGSSMELRGRLIMAASFALNGMFVLGKEADWGIHQVGHQLTAKWGIDHGTTLAITTPVFLEVKMADRITDMARCAEVVFGVREGTEEEKAKALIREIRNFLPKIGMPQKVTEYKYAKCEVKEGDLEEFVKAVMFSTQNKPFGYHGTVTEADVRAIAQKIIC